VDQHADNFPGMALLKRNFEGVRPHSQSLERRCCAALKGSIATAIFQLLVDATSYNKDLPLLRAVNATVSAMKSVLLLLCLVIATLVSREQAVKTFSLLKVRFFFIEDSVDVASFTVGRRDGPVMPEEQRLSPHPVLFVLFSLRRQQA